MPFIEAFRRVSNYTHDFPELTLQFKPNDLGHVVCNVESLELIDRLLATPTGFRLYGVQPEPSETLSTVLTPVVAPLATTQLPEPSGNSSTPEVSVTPVEQSPFVLVNGDSTFDLRPLTDAELFEFVRLNAIPDVHPNSKGDTIRNKIVAFLKASE